MATATYQALTEQEKREVGMFGVTEQGMRQAVERSMTFRYSGPAMMAMSLMSDAQEQMNYDTEDARQTLNRAKWILSEYCMSEERA